MWVAQCPKWALGLSEIAFIANSRPKHEREGQVSGTFWRRPLWQSRGIPGTCFPFHYFSTKHHIIHRVILDHMHHSCVTLVGPKRTQARSTIARIPPPLILDFHNFDMLSAALSANFSNKGSTISLPKWAVTKPSKIALNCFATIFPNA